ncbi:MULTISPECIES: rhodanese-like domain-containing protein [Aeromonas]|jgi:rhodanese-related sulfurtransferase|uniref:Rhodanese-like domain-containing protein n=1 Tax=Aeromonas veronii TaxID=654 RepID=A0A0T6N9U6_AERVE|nr:MULTISPECIES: rhodanese-like domain-containing protein [Aeromonas]HDN9001075.1 sulfurtransferase [Aeromonas veronii AMC24]HDT6079367.1 sulfurtransferase [Aeromonas veronii bv. veronii]AMQ42988.1 sulfurtransferase [Aeromonas veronii]ANB54984.1 sulfurtransferase [Aeromonas veronii]AXV19789.1 sulfurtransferase [Aeromonas veronii]
MHHNPRFLALVDGIRSRITETDVHQIKRWQDEGRTFHLIDVREESEWAKGHLPGARYLGRGVIERDIETQFPDLETELYLYCGGGFRSILAADNLQQMGYRKVISVDGGFRGWCDAGYPVES